MTVTVGEAKDDLQRLKDLIQKSVEDYQRKNTHLFVSGQFYNTFQEIRDGEVVNAVEVSLEASFHIR